MAQTEENGAVAPTPYEVPVNEHEAQEYCAQRGFAWSLATWRAWRQRGGGPRWIKVGGRVRYKPSDLSAFLNGEARS